VLDVRVDHGAQRCLLQVLELRHDFGMCLTAHPSLSKSAKGPKAPKEAAT
jgi:hypothetical protein